MVNRATPDETTLLAARQFGDRAAARFPLVRSVLFGSRARGDHHADSDVDIAVILRGNPDDFFETKMALADIAFDVLLNTGVLIQALPLWEDELRQPAKYRNPALLRNIEHDGISL
jgi:predicted nucleotidyltransferase